MNNNLRTASSGMAPILRQSNQNLRRKSRGSNSGFANTLRSSLQKYPLRTVLGSFGVELTKGFHDAPAANY